MKEIKLTKGLVALVDDEDYEWLNKTKWHAKTDKLGYTYAYGNFNKKRRTMHRVIMEQTNPINIVDHRDTDGLNNQRHNLRVCTKTQNNWNSVKRKDSKNNHKGIRKHYNKFVVEVRVNRKLITVGRYNTELEAIIAYNEFILKERGEFAVLIPLPHSHP